MAVISAGDLTLLRDTVDTQTSNERLYVWGYPEMWRGTLNDAGLLRGDQILATSGGAVQGDFAFADITPGLLVWFGTTAGGNDLGEKLLIGISGVVATPTLVIDWHDDLDLGPVGLTANVTILHYRPPWPKYSWFSAAQGFYKDGPPVGQGGEGLDWTDETNDPPPHIMMGRCAVVPRTPDTDFWWLPSSIVPADVAGAWQAVGAGSQAESYINLNKPGTNDLAVGVAPTWAAATGWTFNGSTQYLSTALTLLSTYTVVVRATPSVPSADGTMFGSNKANATFNILLDHIVGVTFKIDASWGNGTIAVVSASSAVVDRVFALSGNKVYLNGALVGTVSGTFSVGAPSTFPLGAAHDGTSINSFYIGDIKALALYNRQLTDDEVLQVSTQVAALTSTSTSPTAVSLDATNSQAVAVGATLSTYLWAFTPSLANASISNSTSSTATLYIEPSTKLYVQLTLTDSNANSSISYRQIICDDGTLSITEFERTSIREQYDSTSVSCQITLHSPDVTNTLAIRPTVDWSEIKSGTMIIITADDSFDTTRKTISFRDNAIYTDRQNILYCGVIIGEVREYGDPGSISLDTVGFVDVFLYSLSITGVRTATDWFEMKSGLMTIAALLFHLFKYHSTLLEIGDWWLPWTDTVLRSAVEEWAEGDIMQRARSLAGNHGRLMAITANSQGETFVEENSNYLSSSDRAALITTLTLAAEDVASTRKVRVNHRPKVSILYLSGGISQGLMGSFQPFLSVSQDVRKAQGVEPRKLERLMLPDQTETNRLCGRVLGVENRKLVETTLSFSGIYREVFSPTDQQWTDTGTEIFSSSSITNLRGTADMNNLKMVPRQVVKHPPQGGMGQVEVTFDIEAPVELSGRTITLLPIDPLYIAPNINTDPPLLGQPPDLLITGDDTNGVEVYIFDNGSWESRNTGLGGDSLKVRDLKVVPDWWIFQNSTDPENAMVWIATDGGIFFSDDLGKTWDDRTPIADLASAPAGVTPLTVNYFSIDVSPLATAINKTIVAVCRETVTGTIHSWTLISTNSGFNWTNVKHT